MLDLGALLRDGYGPRDDDGAAYGLARDADADRGTALEKKSLNHEGCIFLISLLMASSAGSKQPSTISSQPQPGQPALTSSWPMRIMVDAASRLSAHGPALVRVQSAETLIGLRRRGYPGPLESEYKGYFPGTGMRPDPAEAPSARLRWEYFCSPADRGSGSAAGKLITLANASKHEQDAAIRSH